MADNIIHKKENIELKLRGFLAKNPSSKFDWPVDVEMAPDIVRDVLKATDEEGNYVISPNPELGLKEKDCKGRVVYLYFTSEIEISGSHYDEKVPFEEYQRMGRPKTITADITFEIHNPN